MKMLRDRIHMPSQNKRCKIDISTRVKIEGNGN